MGVNYYKNTNSVKKLYILLPPKRKKSLNFRYLKDGTGFADIKYIVFTCNPMKKRVKQNPVGGKEVEINEKAYEVFEG